MPRKQNKTKNPTDSKSREKHWVEVLWLQEYMTPTPRMYKGGWFSFQPSHQF